MGYNVHETLLFPWKRRSVRSICWPSDRSPHVPSLNASASFTRISGWMYPKDPFEPSSSDQILRSVRFFEIAFIIYRTIGFTCCLNLQSDPVQRNNRINSHFICQTHLFRIHLLLLLHKRGKHWKSVGWKGDNYSRIEKGVRNACKKSVLRSQKSISLKGGSLNSKCKSRRGAASGR